VKHHEGLEQHLGSVSDQSVGIALAEPAFSEPRKCPRPDVEPIHAWPWALQDAGAFSFSEENVFEFALTLEARDKELDPPFLSLQKESSRGLTTAWRRRRRASRIDMDLISRALS